MSKTRKKTSPLDAALACQQKGDVAGAEAGFRAVLGEDPDQPDALVLLGDLLRRTKRAAEGVELIARAIEIAPGQGREADPSWRVALSYAKRDAGDVGGALAEIDGLLQLAPNTLELIFVRAGLLQRLERHEEAIADYENLRGRQPNNAQISNNLGVSLKAVNRLAEASQAFEKALELNPKYTQAMVNKAGLLEDIGQIEAAVPLLRRANALDPGNRKAEIGLIQALRVGGLVGEAEQLAEKIYRQNPEDLDIIAQLGNIQMIMGRRDRAVALAREAYRIDPKFSGALCLLAEADREMDKERLLAEIRAVLGETRGLPVKASLNFAGARVCESLKLYEDAFAHYLEANAARDEQMELLGQGYDRAYIERRIDRLIASFDKERCAGPGANQSELPLFIVGMPRSGTTLTEQVLASHPLVSGAGELTEINRIRRWLTKEHDFPEKLAMDKLRDAANDYLKVIGKVGRGALRVTDKMPNNFMNLGLITRMFPKARIIHCRRSPMDNCVSCFAQDFTSGLSWGFNLENLGHQHCEYQRIMAHWREVLPPDRMLEIDYEDTVADLESQARRLVDFAGLEWDESCLSFHKTERAVATASREQVRNPIYKSSVGRWKRYGDGVRPLIEALSACGCGPEGQ